MSEVRSARGRCLCGGVRFTVRGELREVINCHCERCRRFTGHHMASTSARLDDISIEDEDALLTWFFPVPEAGYGFCSSGRLTVSMTQFSNPRGDLVKRHRRTSIVAA